LHIAALEKMELGLNLNLEQPLKKYGKQKNELMPVYLKAGGGMLFRKYCQN